MTLKEQYEMRQRQWDEFHRWESQQPPIERTPEKMTIPVALLDEGTWCTRPTECVDLGNGLFRLFATPDYDPRMNTGSFLRDQLSAATRSKAPVASIYSL
jgi:hypothetical protein